MDIELKLLLDPADAAGFRRLALIRRYAAGKPVTQQLTRIYFDTPRLHLRQHGVDLHLRGTNSGWIETLQADRDALAGLHYRRKWEAPADGPRPDLAALVARIGQGFDWVAQALTAPATEQGLAPIFECVIRRTTWVLLLADHARIELRLDEGALHLGDIHEPICEVELELKAGDPATLFALALQLQQSVPLRVGNLSKADRGYSLIAAPIAGAVKARPMALKSGQSVEQGFRAILINCLVQMQDNEAGVIGADPESLHQMRVGMRRLHSAQRLFARSMRLPDTLRDELDWLAGELGAARDLDVLADGTLEKVLSACPQEPGLLQLQHALAAMAAESRRQAAASVESARYSRIMLGVVAWLQDSGWRGSLDDATRLALAGPLDELVEKVLARRHRKLLRSGKRLKDGTPRERHRVRIAAKQTRYATEFLRSLLAPRRVKRYLRRLHALQDALGEINDATVADKLLSELGQRQPELRDSAAFARGFLSGHTEQDLHDLKMLWKGFRGMKPPPTRR